MIKYLLIIILLFCSFALIMGKKNDHGVNEKNGNFNVTYHDIEVLTTDGFPNLEITRTYNSKSVELGLFGFGWGSFFETNLVVLPDYSVVVYEYGAGSKTIFRSKLTTRESTEALIDKIANEYLRLTWSKNAEDVAKLKSQMASSPRLVAEFWDRLVTDGGIDPFIIPDGVKLYTTACGCPDEISGSYAYILSTKDGYERHHPKRHDYIQKFNKDGYFHSQFFTSGPYKGKSISTNYDRSEQFRFLTNGADTLSFEYHDNNLFISKISAQSIDSATISYEYYGSNLIRTESNKRSVHEFKYDRVHNMLEVLKDSTRVLSMEYEPKTYFIQKITLSDSTYTKYKYYNKNPEENYVNVYGTTISSHEFNGEIKESRTEEWYIKVDEKGDRFTGKKISMNEADTIVRVYHDLFRKALNVRTSKEYYEIEYSKSGVIQSIRKDDQLLAFIDNWEQDKITQMTTAERTVFFKYIDGKLSHVEDNLGDEISEDFHLIHLESKLFWDVYKVARALALAEIKWNDFYTGLE